MELDKGVWDWSGELSRNLFISGCFLDRARSIGETSRIVFSNPIDQGDFKIAPDCAPRTNPDIKRVCVCYSPMPLLKTIADLRKMQNSLKCASSWRRLSMRTSLDDSSAE